MEEYGTTLKGGGVVSNLVEAVEAVREQDHESCVLEVLEAAYFMHNPGKL